MNEQLVQHLRDISHLYQIKGEAWRGTACARAADNVESFRKKITPDNVNDISGVGKGLAETILEFQKTGTSSKYVYLAEHVDPQCLTMLAVKGIGPVAVRNFTQIGIMNFDDLVEAWTAGKLDVRFDEAMRQAMARRGMKRIPRDIAQTMAAALLAIMKEQKGVTRISTAGSVRRLKETSKDLDVLISAKVKDRPGLIEAFSKLGPVINKGVAKASIWYTLGDNTIQADLLVVPDNSFGAALQYFTGPREHNIELRSLAQTKGFKLNEWGIYQNGRKIAGKNENDIYKALGLKMPPPEQRQ